jgi:GxxExxY protein
MHKRRRPEGDVLRLCDRVRSVALALHSYLRHGHLEKVYENGLAHRLRLEGLAVEQQKPLQARDADGTLLGDYYADLLVEDCLIVEIKACRALADHHLAQVLGYLRASAYNDALLINFGTPRIQIKKLIL